MSKNRYFPFQEHRTDTFTTAENFHDKLVLWPTEWQIFFLWGTWWMVQSPQQVRLQRCGRHMGLLEPWSNNNVSEGRKRKERGGRELWESSVPLEEPDKAIRTPYACVVQICNDCKPPPLKDDLGVVDVICVTPVCHGNVSWCKGSSVVVIQVGAVGVFNIHKGWPHSFLFSGNEICTVQQNTCNPILRHANRLKDLPLCKEG